MRHRNDGPLCHDAPPDVDRYLSGVLVLTDATNDAPAANVGVELTRHDDGAVELQLLRYDEHRRAFADRRDVPIGGQTFEALASALFEPRGEGPAVVGPVVFETTGVTRIDDGRALSHAVREEGDAAGRVTLTVEGIGTDRTETLTEHEPAVASYLASKAEMMRRTAYDHETDAPDRTGVACPACDGEGWDTCALCGGKGGVPEDQAATWREGRYGPLASGTERGVRPPVSADGRMSLRVRSGDRTTEVTIALAVEIAEGGTAVRVGGDDGEPSATVSSAAGEVERHWRRLLGAAMGASPDDDE